MTVAALPSVAAYTENGVTTTFAAPFRFKSPQDLIVDRILVDASLVPLVYNVDYTVTGGTTDAGGTVTTSAAAIAGVTLRIRRRTTRSQPMVYTTGDRFPAKSHEDALDRDILIDQEQDADIANLTARALIVPDGETMPTLGGPSARALKVLGFDALGKLALTSYAAIAGALAPFLGTIFKGDPGGNVMSVGLFVALPTMFIPVGTDLLQTSGSTRGLLIADTTLTDADVAAHPTAIARTANGRYFRRDTRTLDVMQFGAVGSGDGTDDLPAFVAAQAYTLRFPFNQDGGVNQGAEQINIPAGTYRWSNTFYVKGGTFRLQGRGQGKNAAKVSRIIVDAGHHGIIVERGDTVGIDGPSTPPYGYGSDGVIIDGISIESAGGAASATAVNGIVLRARATVTNCQASAFSGVGCLVIASAGSATNQGNANCFLVGNNAFIGNGVHGILTVGADPNAGIISGNDCSYNGRIGIVDGSLLGNTIIGNHCAANGVKGYGGNTVGSSVVYMTDRPYFVMPGQAAAASTTQPGTNAAVWGQLPSGPQAQLPGYPMWYSGIPVFEGGAYAFTSANNRAFVAGNYAEGSQAPVQCAPNVVLVGNTFGEVGLVGIGVTNPMHLTNRQGAADNPGGFSTAMNASQSVTTGYAGHFHEYTDSAIPMGIQLQPTATGMAWTLAGGAALFGFNATNPAGPRAEFGTPLFMPGGGEVGGFSAAAPTYDPKVPAIVFSTLATGPVGWRNPGGTAMWTPFGS